MGDAIRDDVAAEVAALQAHLQKTFDVKAYPHVADGATFDARVKELEAALCSITALFNDYLMSVWSDEITTELDTVEQRKSPRDPAS